MTLLRSSAGPDFAEPFPTSGTPVAYLLDEAARVAAPLAYGADEVLDLARRAAALASDVQDGPSKYLPGGAPGVCAPTARGAKPARIWQEAQAYAIGDYHVGVRADSTDAAEIVARLLAAHRIDDPEVPANYSVVLPGVGSERRRELNLLLRGSTTVVRTRSPRRVLLGLAAHLSCHVPMPVEPGVVRTTNLAVVDEAGNAVLLPTELARRFEQLQPRLARIGARICDEPWAVVDLRLMELVVPAPAVQLDERALDGLDEPASSRAEGPRVEPGRYPLRAWAVWQAEAGGPPPSVASAVAGALTTVASDPRRLPAVADDLAALFAQRPPLGLEPARAEQIVEQLQRSLSSQS